MFAELPLTHSWMASTPAGSAIPSRPATRVSRKENPRMTTSHMARREFLRAITVTGASCLAAGACGAEDGNTLREPVHRVAKANNPPVANPQAAAAAHPLDPALEMAAEAL